MSSLPLSTFKFLTLDEAGLLVEDDLETELMIGRGMNDVIHQQQADVGTVEERTPKSSLSRHIMRSHHLLQVR